MGFNSAFKGLKLFKKTPGNGRLNNLNDLNRPQCVKICVQNLLCSNQLASGIFCIETGFVLNTTVESMTYVKKGKVTPLLSRL